VLEARDDVREAIDNRVALEAREHLKVHCNLHDRMYKIRKDECESLLALRSRSGLGISK